MAESLQRAPRETHEKARCKRLQTSFQFLFENNPLFSPHSTIAFETVEKLGEGGMGSIYRVKDRRMNRQAALKVLLDQSQGDLRQRERFMREARLTAQLDHPNIPAIYEAGCTKDNQFFILMKVIEGETLSEQIKRYHQGRCDEQELRSLLEVLSKVAEAVSYAHSQGILHRDLKPDNVMVGRYGEVLVMDWGLAKEVSKPEDDAFSPGMPGPYDLADEGLTLSGSIIGTPGYMSPEQASGEVVGPLTDVFALGIILTRILTDLTPIPGSSVMEKVVATVKGWISSPRDLKDDVPLELNSLAILATRPDQEQRLPSAKSFQQELSAYLAGTELESHQYGRGELLKRKIQRNPRVLAGWLFTTLILAVLTLSLGEYFVEQAATDLALVNQREADAVVQSQKDIQDAQLAIANEKRRVAKKEAKIAAEMLALFDKAKEMSRRGGKREELTALVEKAVKLGGRDYIVLMTAAEIYDRAGMKEKLPAILNEAVKKHKKPYSALFLLHTLENEKSGDFKFTPHLERIVEISIANNEVNEFTLYKEAADHYQNGDYKYAVDILKQIDQDVDNFYLLHHLKFKIYSNVRNYRDALSSARTCLKIRPNSLEVKNSIAFLLSNLGKTNETEKLYKEILSQDPDHFNTNYNLGELYLHQRKYRLAENYFKNSLRLNPNSTYPYLGFGNLYLAKGNYENAIGFYKKVLSIEPRATLARAGLARSYQSMKQWKQAIIEYSSLIDYFLSKRADLTTEWASHWKERGFCFLKLRNYQQAISDLSFLLKHFPQDFESYAFRALSNLHLKCWSEVIKDCNRALALKNDSTVVLDYRAEAYFRLKDYKRAVRDYDLIVKYAEEGRLKSNALANAKAIRAKFSDHFKEK